MVVGTVVREFGLELLREDIPYGRERITLGPIGGIPMRRVALPRRSADDSVAA